MSVPLGFQPQRLSGSCRGFRQQPRAANRPAVRRSTWSQGSHRARNNTSRLIYQAAAVDAHSSVDRDATATASTSGHQHASAVNGHATSRAQHHSAEDATDRIMANQPSTAAGQTDQAGPGAPGPAPGTPHHTDATRSSSSSSLSRQEEGKELYLEIKACETWQDVLDIVADEARTMTLGNCVHALSRLNKLMKEAGRGKRAEDGKSLTGPKSSAYKTMVYNAGFKRLCARLVAEVGNMNTMQLCNSLYAMVQLEVPVGSAALKTYADRAGALARYFNERDMTMLLHTFAGTNHKVSLKNLDLLGYRTTQLLEEGKFTPQGFSMLLYSCAVLDYHNSWLLSKLVDQAVKDLPGFTPQGVATSLWACAKLGFYSDALVEASMKYFNEWGKDFKPRETCNLLWGLTHYRHHPKEAFAPIVRSLLEKSDSLSATDVASLMYCLATFGVLPGKQAMNLLCKRAEAVLAELKPLELCNVYWSLGLLGETDRPVIAKIAGLLPALFEKQELNEGMLRQVFQGLLCSKLAAAQDTTAQPDSSSSSTGSSSSGSSVAFPPLMMDAMKRAWVSSAHGRTSMAPAGPKQGSGQQMTVKEEVFKILRALGVRHDTNRPTKDGLVSIDIALKPTPERYVALQVVMEHEHTRNTGQFLRTITFQRDVLEMNGWEVRHLRAMDLKALDDKSKPLFIAEYMRSIGCRVRMPQADDGGAVSGALGSRLEADVLMGSKPPRVRPGGRGGAKPRRGE